MIESNILSWLALFSLLMVSTLAGIGLSRLIPWSSLPISANVDVVFGFAIAPFLAGMASVLALKLFPGGSHLLHIVCTYGFLVMGSLLVFKPYSRKQNAILKSELADSLLIVLLLIWALLLLVNAIFIPLFQNDALEYATVGRELFNARDLAIYPLLDPKTNLSGFFAPWTHPPLYVSLIYLMSVLQGHADAPGLMRLIAPWFLLTATYATVMLGRLQATNVGWLAGVLMISTPLLFLGADSALIDALPVSGIVLLLLLMTGVSFSHRLYGVIVGAVLGVTLWTHSQAILFIPLIAVLMAFQFGLMNKLKSATTVVIVFVAALVFGGWPYLRNFLLFGSPVSDSPAVFSMPELDWRSYFAYARGLDHTTAIIQYGVFKGWFSLEAYGLLFWFGSGGVLLFILHQRKHLVKMLGKGIGAGQERDTALWLGFVLLLAYFAGVVLSVSLGIDLMIRNERYMLVVAPIFALFGAYFLHSLMTFGWKYINARTANQKKKNAVVLMFGSLAVILLLQLFVVGWFYRWREITPKPAVTEFSEESLVNLDDITRFDWIMRHRPSTNVVRKIYEELPQDAKVLAIRPADMYYADRRMVSYLDESLLPFYREKELINGAAKLRQLGIRYVFMTDYALPPVYNSSLMSILATPSLSRLVYSSGMMQLYELVNTGDQTGEVQDLTPGNIPWTRTLQLRIGGRKAVNALGFRPTIFNGGESVSSLPIFHRDYSVILATGQGASLWGGKSATFTEVKPGGEYVVRMNLKGEGYIVLWLQQFDAKGIPILQPTIAADRPTRIGDVSLSEKNQEFEFARRLRVQPETSRIRIGVEHIGRSKISISKMTLESVAKTND